ncbi:hypothetical protein PG991_003490 [Apiospora marii]|uniref:Uncharacterized protein n=1 Tax=Apiospora marii TaxID=335849 RepID=A0ABR1S3H3_9PEZI
MLHQIVSPKPCTDKDARGEDLLTSLIKDLPRVVERRAQGRLQRRRVGSGGRTARIAQRRRARRLDRLEALLEARDELVAEAGAGLVGLPQHLEVDADVGKIWSRRLPRPALDGLQHDQRRPRNHDEIPIRPDRLVIEVQPQSRARREQQLELLVRRDAVRVQVAPPRRVVNRQDDEAVQHVLAEHQGAVLLRHGRRSRGQRRVVLGGSARPGGPIAAEVDEPLVQLPRPVPYDGRIHRAERTRGPRRIRRRPARIKTRPDRRQAAPRKVREPHARLADVGLGQQARQNNTQHRLEGPLLGLDDVGVVGGPADLAAGDAELRDGVAEHGEVVRRQLRRLGRSARARAVEDRRQQDRPRRREGLLAGQEVQARHRLVEAQPELLDQAPLPDDAAAHGGRGDLLQGGGSHPQRAQCVVLGRLDLVFFHRATVRRVRSQAAVIGRAEAEIVLNHLEAPHDCLVDLRLGRVQDAQVDGKPGGVGPGTKMHGTPDR